MAVRADCRHYLSRTATSGDVAQRCRLAVNLDHPFACPADCLFFEGRAVSEAGWSQGSATPMSNTADGLIGLPPAPKGRKKRR